MPLKPIFEKSPLMTLNQISLRPGQVKCDDEHLRQLYALTAACKDHPALWEGSFRLACILCTKPLEEPCAKWVTDILDLQNEDGALPYGVEKSVQVMRAALAMYELDARRPLLEKMALWCAWAAQHWDDVMACDAVRIHPADLMELLQAMYRITGKKALVKLCDMLRQQAMNWSGVLSTFAVQRPMARVTPWEDMEAGLAAEGGSEAGFYTRQYLTCHGESLADGMRAAVLNGQFSGNGQELASSKTGWEKITRYHGAVCGGITADETIGGTSPSCAVDAASLGAWAEALCLQDTNSTWAYDALEKILSNGLSAALQDGKLVPFQRVNSLQMNCGIRDCYHVHEENQQALRALARLCRGWAKAVSTAVAMTQDGAAINLYRSGRYALPLGDGACVLQVEGDEARCILTLKLKKEQNAALYLRIPAWTENACITVNQEGGEEGKSGTWLKLERTWQDGDVITVEFPRTVRVEEGHHQGVCIRYGSKVMAYVPQEDVWNVALCGDVTEEDGHVFAELCTVPDWHIRGSVPADLPVLPSVKGDVIRAELVPYAQAPCRIAMFPRGHKA